MQNFHVISQSDLDLDVLGYGSYSDRLIVLFNYDEFSFTGWGDSGYHIYVFVSDFDMWLRYPLRFPFQNIRHSFSKLFVLEKSVLVGNKLVLPEIEMTGCNLSGLHCYDLDADKMSHCQIRGWPDKLNFVKYRAVPLVDGGLAVFSQDDLSRPFIISDFADSNDGAFVQLNGLKEALNLISSTILSIDKNRVLVFGGWNTNECFNDLYELNLSLRMCRKIEMMPGDLVPSPRNCHGAVMIDDRRMAVIGGRNSNGVGLSDIWILDTFTWQWSQVDDHPPFNTDESYSIRAFNIRGDIYAYDVRFARMTLVIKGRKSPGSLSGMALKILAKSKEFSEEGLPKIPKIRKIFSMMRAEPGHVISESLASMMNLLDFME